MQLMSLMVPTLALAVASFAAFLGYQYVSLRRRVSGFILATLTSTKEIVYEETYPSNKARLAHEVVKKLYDDIPEQLASGKFKADLSKLRHALGAARVYYWVRALEGATMAELKNILLERTRRINHGCVRSASLDRVLNQVVSSTSMGLEISALELEELKMQCESDIAELETHWILVKFYTKWRNRS